MQFIRTLNQVQFTETDLYGTRACDLAHFLAERIPVPPTFVLGTVAWDTFLQHNNIQYKIDFILKQVDINNEKTLVNAYNSIRKLIVQHALPEGMMMELREAYESLGISREAAVDEMMKEDLSPFVTMIASPSYVPEAESYEGIIQNIRGLEELFLALKETFAMAYTPEAIRYRAQLGIKKFTVGMIVQSMPGARASATAYSTDPEQQDLTFVHTYLGYMDLRDLVAKDFFHVKKEFLNITATQVVEQPKIIVREEDGQLQPEEYRDGRGQSLNDKEVMEVARLAKKAEKVLDNPVKVFFTITDKESFVLFANQYGVPKMATPPAPVAEEVAAVEAPAPEVELVEELPEPEPVIEDVAEEPVAEPEETVTEKPEPTLEEYEPEVEEQESVEETEPEEEPATETLEEPAPEVPEEKIEEALTPEAYAAGTVGAATVAEATDEFILDEEPEDAEEVSELEETIEEVAEETAAEPEEEPAEVIEETEEPEDEETVEEEADSEEDEPEDSDEEYEDDDEDSDEESDEDVEEDDDEEYEDEDDDEDAEEDLEDDEDAEEDDDEEYEDEDDDEDDTEEEDVEEDDDEEYEDDDEGDEESDDETEEDAEDDDEEYEDEDDDEDDTEEEDVEEDDDEEYEDDDEGDEESDDETEEDAEDDDEEYEDEDDDEDSEDDDVEEEVEENDDEEAETKEENKSEEVEETEKPSDGPQPPDAHTKEVINKSVRIMYAELSKKFEQAGEQAPDTITELVQQGTQKGIFSIPNLAEALEIKKRVRRGEPITDQEKKLVLDIVNDLVS